MSEFNPILARTPKAIGELVKEAYGTAIERGQYESSDPLNSALRHLKTEATKLYFAVQNDHRSPVKAIEISSFEEYKEQVSGTIEDELCDIFIMACSLAGFLGVDDFGLRVYQKMGFNRERSKK